MAIATSDFEFVRDVVRRGSGIVLDTGKEYLVEARLGALAREQKLESIGALVEKVRGCPAGPLQRLMIEAMTTNETSFFRDVHPFEAFKKVVLPELIASRASARQLSIWCGASSTGQEPYSIAMILCETIPRIEEWKISFIATDLSSEMVARSREGKYNQIEINRGLPAAYMVKYFAKTGMEWQASLKLRAMVDFREMNLTMPWPALPSMDIVFLRNVMIYFDTETKRDILGRIRRVLRPDGCLFLGSAETTMGLDDAYERAQIDKSGCYRVRSSGAAPSIQAKAA